MSKERILVGLRWWNEVKSDGSEEWVFESLNVSKSLSNKENNGGVDSFIFWTVLYVTPIIWTLIFVFSFFSFSPKSVGVM
jgi:hypothetical protein